MNAVLKEMHPETAGHTRTQVYSANGAIVSDFTEPEILLDPETIYGVITRKNEFGISHETLTALKNRSSIGIHFSTATEGRPYSLAIRLREQGYKGELHALGNLNQEIVYHLIRVGFTHFHLARTTGAQIDSTILAPFGGRYQQTFIEFQPALGQVI